MKGFQVLSTELANTMKNAIVFNAILAIALATRQALDFVSRHFGKQVVQGYMKDGGTWTAPEGADAEAVKTFNKSHLPTLRLAGTMAKAANVTFHAFTAELETVRLAEIARIKAEDEAKKAMKEGAKKPASAPESAPVKKAA